MTPDAEPAPETSGTRQMVLTFRLDGECFALVVQHVNEIIDPIEQTPVPNAHPCVPALANVRGAVVPVFDIRRRLGMGPHGSDVHARFVVVDLEVGAEAARLALPVDSVEDVLEANLGALQELPELGARWPKEYITGICQSDDALLILLNTNTLFDLNDAARPSAA